MQAFSQFPVSDEEFAGKKSVTAFVVFCLKSSVICVLQVASTENKNIRDWELGKGLHM
jgi:hypothetical protein